MITPEQHVAIGRMFGYPECCIAEWVAAPRHASIRHGSVILRPRRPDEYHELLPRALEILGDRARVWLHHALSDPYVKYVPCSACAWRAASDDVV